MPTSRMPYLLVALWLGTALPVPAAEDCAACHQEDPDPAAFAASAHGFLECANCHTEIDGYPHPEQMLGVDCSSCHDDVVAEYATSIHGKARAEGETEAPACATCHGEIHQLVPSSNPASPVNPQRLPETCGHCHSDPKLVRKFGIPVARPIEAYEASVHGKLALQGEPAPSCNDCHGSHAILPSSDPESIVNHQRVPQTCGKCHTEIAEVYEKSVHGQAAEHGAREAPVCTDCHGEHRILSPREEGSPVFASNIPKMTCGRCHSDVRLADKFGIESDTVEAYADSYHGLASRSGKVTVANCASCHGVHDILPSSDPASHVYPSNLPATCGACHPGAGTKFAIGRVHIQTDERSHTAVYWVRWGYLLLIWLTVGGMVAHNALDLYRKARRPAAPRAPTAAPSEERLSRGFRIAHLALMVSFAVLAYTGFALTSPESWWARPLLRWEEQLGLRGGLHRAAAVVMLVALLFHLLHLAVDRRARACIAGMRPSREDLVELRERLAWFVGRRRNPPPTPRLGYPEKMEYLALMWGLVVMAGTGFLLWFDNLLLRFLPKWVGDVATVIHFYEAVLASLAILVWHLYFVIFDPVVYPMDTAWLTGRSSPGREAERREHAAAGERTRPGPSTRPTPTPGARTSGTVEGS